MNCLSAPASTEVKQWIKVECFGQLTSYSIILLLIINVHESPCSCSGSRQHRVDPQPRAGTPRAGKRDIISKCQIYALLANLYVYLCVCLVLLCNRHLICKPVLPNPLHLPVIISNPNLSKEKIP